jgi:tRNA (guanine37-N1)-methyltransferase
MRKKTLAIKVLPSQADSARKECARKGLLASDFKLEKCEGAVYIAVKERFDSQYDFVHVPLETAPESKNLRESLQELLSKEEQVVLRTSMDVIGGLAILEIPKMLEGKEEMIALEVLKANKKIKTVLKKGRHEGVFRTQKLKWLAGEDTRVAECKENNVTLKVDVEKVYFTPRLSSERKRISSLVNKGEDVLVMFSGCGPYTCVIAKNTLAKKVVGVEINPAGHKYALENIRINKLKNAFSTCGDAKKIVPALGMKFDRIVMPLPQSAEEYLSIALTAANKGATIHFYDFELQTESGKGVEKVRKACLAAGRKWKLAAIVKAGQSSPRAYRYCLDFKVE